MNFLFYKLHAHTSLLVMWCSERTGRLVTTQTKHQCARSSNPGVISPATNAKFMKKGNVRVGAWNFGMDIEDRSYYEGAVANNSKIFLERGYIDTWYIDLFLACLSLLCLKGLFLFFLSFRSYTSTLCQLTWNHLLSFSSSINNYLLYIY